MHRPCQRLLLLAALLVAHIKYVQMLDDVVAVGGKDQGSGLHGVLCGVGMDAPPVTDIGPERSTWMLYG
jgi:hypothetical protein